MSDPSTSLDRLHDVVAPAEISWWPLAPGWYVVGAALLVLVGLFTVRSWKKWKANAYRRAALRELETAGDIPSIAAILRRTALVATSRAVVASKAGAAWTDWLAAAAPAPMEDDVRQQLTREVYAPVASGSDTSKLRDYADQWIRNHQLSETWETQ